jgi:hypothetical protein
MTAVDSAKYGRGIIESVPGIGILRAYGETVPTDGDTGYASTCCFQKLGGTTLDTVLYVNIGTQESCNFDAAILAS